MRYEICLLLFIENIDVHEAVCDYVMGLGFVIVIVIRNKQMYNLYVDIIGNLLVLMN